MQAHNTFPYSDIIGSGKSKARTLEISDWLSSRFDDEVGLKRELENENGRIRINPPITTHQSIRFIWGLHQRVGQVSLFLGQVSTLTGYKTWGGRSFLSLFVALSLNFKFSFPTLATLSVARPSAVFASASLATAPLSCPTLALYLAPIKIQDELRNLHTRHTRVPCLRHNIRVLS